LIDLFRGSGQEADEETTGMLLSKFRGCEDSREQQAIQYSERVAEQFLKDFGRLDGV
jgi:hypothetical protein